MQTGHSLRADRDALLGDLNAAQRDAVTRAGGPLLVLAGAGTGKTRVLTRRVAWLIAQGLPASAVLAITFTNKAADVLRRRLSALPSGAGVWAGTFHGFGAFLLRRHGEDVGLDRRFTILDRDDQRSLLKTIYKDLEMDTGRLRPVDAAELISHRKNGGGGHARLNLQLLGAEAEFDAIFAAYGKRLRAGALLDFDDLLLESLRLLKTCDDVADLYRARFVHVLVDEYQDTNLVQRDLLKALLGPQRNLTVVGDPDQSIYRWRGAAVSNILQFADDFPGAGTVLLEQNYRSTGHILGAAEAVIERNRERHAKRLFTTHEDGAPVLLTRCRDGEEEGQVVATQIEAWAAAGWRLDDMAVFYRVNSLSRAVELALSARGTPYVVVAGTEFFRRREVKDVLAYARLVENPNDEAAFLRVVNTPRRGVGATSLARLREAALSRSLPILEAAALDDTGVSSRARGGLRRLLALLDRARAMPRAPVAPVLEALVEGSGYRAALEDSPDEIDQGRADNVGELIAYAREFDAKEAHGDLQAFLEQASLVSDQDAWDEGGSGRVSLMSVHAAKGLEFPCVAIAGAEFGYFPHLRSLGEAAGEEEERRLFYVAMTRAQRHLAVTHAARRQTWTGEEGRVPSPYLQDIPPERVQVRDRATGYGVAGSWGADVVHDPAGACPEPVHAEMSGFEVGERVLHPYFGAGRLEAVGGRGEDTRVTVDFEAFGRKQLLLRHARLEKMP